MSDLIERQAAIDALAKHEKSNGHNYTLFVDIVSECAEIIRELPSAQPETCEYWDRESNFCALHRPSAQPERKKGVWIDDKGLYRCSVCNNLWTAWWIVACPKERMYKEMKFCPNCGADMRGDDNEPRL